MLSRAERERQSGKETVSPFFSLSPYIVALIGSIVNGTAEKAYTIPHVTAAMRPHTAAGSKGVRYRLPAERPGDLQSAGSGGFPLIFSVAENIIIAWVIFITVSMNFAPGCAPGRRKEKGSLGVLWQTLKDVKKPRIAILGAGLSGRAVLEFLVRGVEVPEMSVTLRDRKEAPCPDWAAEIPYVTWKCGETWLSDLCEGVIFRSPGIRPDLPELTAARAAGAVVTSETALFCRRCPARLYAVTGSDGKTTTASMTYTILQKAHGADRGVYLGGNIGHSLLPELRRMREGDDAVLELSSFQLCDLRPKTRAAAFLNLTENHLNWHTDMREYREAKINILPLADRRVLSADDPVTLSAARQGDCLFSALLSPEELCRRFAGCPFVCLSGGRICYCDDGALTPVMEAATLPLSGKHQLLDAMAAIALVWGDVPTEAMAEALCAFRGVPHRMQTVAVVRGVRCIDSSIDTTPARTETTLSALPGHPTVLCGGSDKGVSFRPLARALLRRAGCVVLTGQTSRAIREALEAEGAPGKLPLFVCDDFDEAVARAFSHTPAGETLLLSPACASFDRFRNYAERGEHFAELVRKLG